MESTNRLLVFLILMLPLLGQDEAGNAEQPPEKTNRAIRKEAFDFLFEEFLPGKQCVWSADSHLQEVTVFERVEKQQESVEKGKTSIALPAGSNRIVGFFDRLVLQGKRLTSFESIQVRLDSKLFHARLAKKEKDEYSLGIPPLPLPDGKSAIAMELVLNEDGGSAIVDQVSFRTNTPFSNRFDEYVKRTSAHLVNNDNRFDEDHVSFLEKTDELGIDALAGSLRDQSEEFARIVLPAQLTATTDIISINGILADRRVSRLYELMSRMERDEAAAVAGSNFENELSRFMDDWKNSDILPARKRYAAEALLFLCSEFCAPTGFIKNIDRWENWHKENRAEKSFQFKNQGRPDFLLVANLYANVIAKQRNMTLDEVNAWLEVTLAPVLSEGSPSPILQQRWLPSSDWTSARIDLIADVPAFQSFRSVINEEIQKRVLSRLRSEVD